MTKVLWTIRAKNRLRSSWAKQFCKVVCLQPAAAVAAPAPQKALDALLRQPEEILAGTFPNADTVVVRNQLVGFRPKEHVLVLVVEVFDKEESGPYIVKIGPVDRLRRELDNWNRCRPFGLHHDPVFLPLREGCAGAPPADPQQQPQLMSLVYGDAHQLIGVAHAVTLEEAVLGSVLFGLPTVPSVGVVIMELLERTGHMLYGQSFVDDPAGREDYQFFVRHLAESLDLWDHDVRLGMVRTAASLAVRGVGSFIDPVDYFRYTQNYVSWAPEPRAAAGCSAGPCPGAPCLVSSAENVVTGEASARPDDSRLTEDAESAKKALAGKAPTPCPANLIPRLLRGAMHGDLHGRNVLVGIVHDRAVWPALFDYEDMSVCDLVAWDFAKLETELKIRAYTEMFATLGAMEPAANDEFKQRTADEKHETTAFVAAVQQSELRLNEATEMSHRLGHWPPVEDKNTPLERLCSILLEVRRMAQVHLGIDRGRPNDWLEEYYFVLACYGVTTARFANLNPRQWLAAYLSAGVAASRLTWPREEAQRQ